MTAIFPTPVAIPGLGYPVQRTLIAQTIMQKPPSLRDVTSACFTHPLREWRLTFNVLRKTASFSELQTIAGFFLSRMGSFQAFWYTDPTDFTVTNSLLGAGDGANQTFVLARDTGPSFFEAVDQVNAISQVRVNGVPTAAYTITQPNLIVFNVAPPIGQTVRADFTYYMNVRFSEDAQQYDQFMRQLYDLKTCRFRSARL